MRLPRPWSSTPPSPNLAQKVRIYAGSGKGAGSFADEIDKRLKTIARSRAFLEWDKSKPLSQELEHLRKTIATRLGETDRGRAVELLWDFIAMADAVIRRLGDGVGEVEAIFDAAMVDLAGSAQPYRLWKSRARSPAAPSPSPIATAIPSASAPRTR
jgi:hypothetical protein